MGNGQLQITIEHQNNINQKFGQLLREAGISDAWPNTVAEEQTELDILLMSQPTINDVIEYLDTKTDDWNIGIGTIHEGSTSYKIGKQLIGCYNTLTDYVARIDKNV